VKKQGQGCQRLQTDESHQEHVEAVIRDNCQIEQKNSAPKLEISKERVGNIINLLGFRNFVPSGYHEN
jgi:hypothetical protein